MKAASIKKLPAVQGYQTPSSQTASLSKKSHKTFDYLGLPPPTATTAATITSRNADGQGLLHMGYTEIVSARNNPSEYYYRTFAEETKSN